MRVAKAKPRPAKPKKEALPVTVSFLDEKNGFRDVKFGESETKIANLVGTSRDETRGLRTCIRSDEMTSLHGVPLERVEYRFFRGELYAVELSWRIAYANSTSSEPPTTDMSVFLCRGIRQSADSPD